MSIEADFENMSLEKVREFIAQGQEEHLQLDFKTVKHATLNSEDDKRNFAIALSGFANSSGGLIVWGVTTTREGDVDHADGEKPVSISTMLPRLNTLTGEGVSPSVAGVRHRGIPIIDNEGFVISLIPESDGGPHMARLGEYRYYKRSGSNFYKMEHFDVADMFGRRQRPNLALTIARASDPEVDDLFDLWVTNIGRALARHCSMNLRFDNVERVVVSEGSLRDITPYNGGRPSVGWGSDLQAIHANGIRLHIGKVRLFRKDVSLPVKATVRLDAEHMLSVEASTEIAPGTEETQQEQTVG